MTNLLGTHPKSIAKCRICNNSHAVIRKYGINICRQCFRERANQIGFQKVIVHRAVPLQNRRRQAASKARLLASLWRAQKIDPCGCAVPVNCVLRDHCFCGDDSVV